MTAAGAADRGQEFDSATLSEGPDLARSPLRSVSATASVDACTIDAPSDTSFPGWAGGARE